MKTLSLKVLKILMVMMLFFTSFTVSINAEEDGNTETPVCTCVEKCENVNIECEVCANDVSLCEGVEMMEVSYTFNWIDNGNNDDVRPDAEAVFNVWTATGYDAQGNPVNTIQLTSDNATYSQSGTSGATVKVRVPKTDAQGNSLTYVFEEDEEKLLNDLGYLKIVEDEQVYNLKAVDFVVYIEDIDGANTENGNHVDFVKDLYENDLLELTRGGQTVEWDDLTWSFDETTGIGTLTYKALPKYPLHGNGTPFDYRVTMNGEEMTICGKDDLFLVNGDDKYQIVYDNTAVPNKGAETTYTSNGGTIKLTLKDKEEYNATKYWLDNNRAEERPQVRFELWRYTDLKDGSKSYRTASPVRDENNLQIYFNVDGKQEGSSTALTISTEEEALKTLTTDLEKYDANGYQYIYFLRETMTIAAGDPTYVQVFDIDVGFDMVGNPSSIVEMQREDKQDKSIYNKGTIGNRVSETMTTSTVKTWKVSAYIDQIEHVQVEMKLQYTILDDNDEPTDWLDFLNDDGSVYTQKTSGFNSTSLTRRFSESVPKYDELGRKLGYRWIEKAVIENQENRLNENTQTFKLDINDENSWPADRVDTIGGYQIPRQNNEYFTSNEENGVITNRLTGEEDYVVLKQWQDADGNPAAAPDGASISFLIKNNKDLDPIRIDLDGVVDDVEIHPWLGHITDLPKYTKDGALIEYKAYEISGVDGYTAYITNNEKDHITIVANRPGEGVTIPVMKKWIDDDDSGCRYPSFVELFYRDPRTQEVTSISRLTGNYTELSEENTWLAYCSIPSSFLGNKEDNPARWNSNNYFIQEVALKSMGDDGYKVETTKQYGDLNGIETVTTDKHMYVTSYGVEEGIKYVSNRRVGTIDITVTKKWIDMGADYSKRPDAIIQLEPASDNVEVTPTGVKVEDVKEVTLPTSYRVDKTKESGSTITYTFNGLPKYDKEGKVVAYSVSESWSNLNDPSIKEYVSLVTTGYYAEHEKAQPATANTASVEEKDLEEVQISNKRQKSVNVVFYKEWNDDYAVNQGHRPDIYVELYSKTDDQPGALGYRTNVWTLDDRQGRNDGRRYWKVEFDDQPRYDDNGAEITYYAKESTNGPTAQFDYQDTYFKDGTLADVVLDENEWVLLAKDQSTVLHENGTFVNGVKAFVRLLGKKVWENIPEGFSGDLPEIEVQLYRYLENEPKTNAKPVTITNEDGEEVNVFLSPVVTPEGERSISFSFYHEDGVPASDTHYDYSPEKYNEQGVLYEYVFEEVVLDTTNRTDEINLTDLFNHESDGNLILTNVYPGENYLGQLSITKDWDNRPENVPYPKVTFELHRYYENTNGVSSDTKLETQEVAASSWKNADFKVTFNDKKFPIYAPDGYKYIYYVVENHVDGYNVTQYVEFTDGVTNVTEGSLAEKNAFTFNKPGEKSETVTAIGDVKNTYTPEKTTLTGIKTWNDRNNMFNTRPSIDNANEVLQLRLYRQADSQSGQNNGIAREEVTGVTPTWSQESNSNKWKYTYTNLDVWAPNGMKWKYTVTETVNDEYKVNYSPNQTWNTVQGVAGNTVSAGDKSNALAGQISVEKTWESKSYMIRPQAIFELQVKLGDGQWQHAKDVAPFSSATTSTAPFSYNNQPWIYRIEDKGTSTQTKYTGTWSNVPLYVDVDGTWTKVSYRFVEIQVGETVLFDSHTKTSSCLNDPVVYPTIEDEGQYQPVQGNTTTSKSGNYQKTTTSISNRLVGGHVKLRIEKIWTEDSNNFYNTRPTSLEFKIQYSTDGTTFADYVDNKGAVCKTTVTASDNWVKEVNNLPKYDEEGNEMIYQAVETNLPSNYEFVKIENSTADYGFTSNTTNELLTTELEGTKTWVTPFDMSQTDIELVLHRQSTGAEETTNYVPTALTWNKQSHTFTYKFDKLPAKDSSGNDYTYWVEERTVNGFITTYDSSKTNITNTITALRLNKVGDQGVNISDDLLQLVVKDGNTTIATWTRASGQTTGTFTLASGITSNAKFVNVKTNGDLLLGLPVGSYSIVETVAPVDYKLNTTPVTVNITASNTAENAAFATVTNEYETKQLNITKTWDDDNNRDGKRPINIEVKIYDGTTVVETCQLSAGRDGIWQQSELTYTSNPLRKYRNGVEIEYTIEETYYGEDGEYEPSYDGFEITNTHEPELINIEGNKFWDDADDQDGIRPEEITIYLVGTVNSTVIYRDSKTISAGDDGKWHYEFNGLYKYHEGSEIEYAVTESEVDEYEGTLEDFDFTNKHTPYTIDISGEKTWDDNDDQDGKRPEEITLILTGKVGDEMVYRNTITVEADEDGNWTYEWKDLAKRYAGQDIDYSIEEAEVKYYEASYNGYDVNNYHEIEKIDIEVQKIWNDMNNYDHIRPKKVTIHLFANGEEIDCVEVEGKNGWKHTFTNLDKYSHGEEIVYTITEDKVNGYGTKINGFKVTNTHIPNLPPDTSDNTHTMTYVIMMIISMLGIIVFSRKAE